MEDLTFDISGILSEEEAAKIFDESAQEPEEPQTPEQPEEPETPAEEEPENPSETVGEEDNDEDGSHAIPPTGDGDSPNIYSSIASALKKDGIFPDFDDKDLEGIKGPDDFAELFEKAITAKFDERQKRIDEALGNGVQPDTVRQYESTIASLEAITEEMLSAEDEDGENQRRMLIYNDLITRGYSEEKARKEVEKSFKSGSDLDDAKDALEALKQHFKTAYANIQGEAKKKADGIRAEQKKQSDAFKKMVLEDEVKIGETKLDKNTCQKVFDAVAKPTYKDPDTGHLMTEVQKFQKENPLEFLKQLGMWYVLTDGGKNLVGFTKAQVRAEKNKHIKELERKINASSLNPDGTLKFASGNNGGNGDPLLSDGWKIG